MYVPKHFEENDASVLHALIRAHPLGTWVAPSSEGLLVNHIPLLLDGSRGAHGTLIGHVSRANAVWRSFATDTPSVVVFQGAESYITPSWYPSKDEHGRTVPTWNYVVVHAHGTPRAIEDTDWLRAHVTALSDHHEAGREKPWRVTDAPAEYIDAQLKGIVGIEIPIDRLVGKWKTSQNRSAADRVGVIAGLSARDDTESREMAELVRSAHHRSERIDHG